MYVLMYTFWVLFSDARNDTGDHHTTDFLKITFKQNHSYSFSSTLAFTKKRPLKCNSLRITYQHTHVHVECQNYVSLSRYHHITSFQARSSHPEVFYKKDVLENVAKSTEKSLFLLKLKATATTPPGDFFREYLCHQCW